MGGIRKGKGGGKTATAIIQTAVLISDTAAAKKHPDKQYPTLINRIKRIIQTYR
jgi:hypothetical protein